MTKFNSKERLPNLNIFSTFDISHIFLLICNGFRFVFLDVGIYKSLFTNYWTSGSKEKKTYKHINMVKKQQQKNKRKNSEQGIATQLC